MQLPLESCLGWCFGLSVCPGNEAGKKECGKNGKGFADQVVKAPGAKMRSPLV